ncbi:hypothetical protein [Aeromonas caviae]|uniref:Uncharacterized protein n=1 Tax=Aeromonas caviae TaxID=648 RepID=A0AAJ5Z684_AERCA|nr:hypothetical protein [Aeromonas caviae]WFF97854.1 hypothetical protein P5S46_19875 [Aeromonas caviae]
MSELFKQALEQAKAKNRGVYTSDDESKFVKQRRSNTKSDLIEITEDKLENILIKHLDKISYRSAWIAPASILATLATVKTTATFNDSFGVKAAVWEGMTIILGVICLGWTLYTLLRIWYYKSELSLESLLTKIKNTQA